MRVRWVPAALLAAAVAPAQQAEPRIELYGLSGFYSTGTRWAPFQPQAGAGVLVPLGRDWAVLVDATADTRQTDMIELYGDSYRREFYERNPEAVDDDVRLRWHATLRPSLVWMLRRNRFSIYVGAGMGFEWYKARDRFREVRHARNESGFLYEDAEETVAVLVRDEQYTEWDDRGRDTVLIARFGVIADLAPRIAVRAGYSCLMGDPDNSLAGAVEFGVGFRF